MKSILQSFNIAPLLMLIALVSSCNNKTKSVSADIVEPKSISATLAENNHLPVSERIDLYYKLINSNASKNGLEDQMNRYGYSLLWDDKLTEATEIFKLVVSEFPQSSNAYDSLAEAYQKAGDNENAIANYEKSLALDSDNYNAEDQIELIKNPDQKRLEPKEKFSKKYSVTAYREDLDQLGETLMRVHPNALKFISKEKLIKLIEDKKALINEHTSYADFTWHCSEIVANINCSHTSTEGFYQKNRTLPLDLRFPAQTRLVENRLFIIDPLNNKDLITHKDEVISINGIAVKDLIEKIYNHIPSQGYISTSKRHAFNTWSTVMIPYSLGFPTEYKIEVSGTSDPILLSKAEYHNDPMQDKSKVYCGDNLCLEFVDTKKKIAIMTISSFNYYKRNNFADFVRFVDESMEEMNKHTTKHLIIDVRGNGGGSPESSIHLLRYLIHKPFVYYSKAEYPGKTEKISEEKTQLPFENGFNGKLSFIIDGRGNSTTGHFMSIVKDKKLGVIVGEELGSNQFCSAGQKRCRLSNTKMEYYVANNTHVSTATSFPDEVGILPDHYVTQSIDDYIDAKDVVKQFTIDLIDEVEDWKPASKYNSSFFLDINSEWDKELFRIPLNFAPGITLRGLEDARFPKGWNKTDSLTFWSYVFAWNVDHPEPVSKAELESNLELYFDGLMKIEERSKVPENDKTNATFNEIQSSPNKITYKGSINTFDGFFEKKPLTFNVQASQNYCQETERAIIVFRFSPQSYDSSVWDKLNEVKLPEDICKR